MEPIPENIALEDIHVPHSCPGASGTQSAPSRLQSYSAHFPPAHVRTRAYSAPRRTPRPQQSSTVNNTSHLDNTRTPPAPRAPNDLADFLSLPMVRPSNETSRSSSVYTAVPIPHLGSVARVPRHLHHQYQNQHHNENCQNSNDSNNNSSSRRGSASFISSTGTGNSSNGAPTFRAFVEEARRKDYLQQQQRREQHCRNRHRHQHSSSPLPRHSYILGVLAPEGVDLEAGPRDSGDFQQGEEDAKEGKYGVVKRCWISFLKCWFGWEGGKVYYGGRAARRRVVVG